MPIRLLMMVAGYVVVCVAIFKFWPQAEGDVVVATQKIAPAEQIQPVETTTQVADPVQPAVEDVQVQPVQPARPVEPTPVVVQTAPKPTSQERLISSADRMALLEVWTIIEECRINRCESMNLTNVSLNFIPDEVKDLRRLNTLVVGAKTSNIEALRGMRNVRILNLNNSLVKDIEPASALNGLKFLEISNTEIADLTPLENLGALEHIDFSNSQVSDIGPLENLVNLRFLNASGSNVFDVSSVGNMYEMQELNLNDTRILDLSALSALDKLRTLSAARTDLVVLPDLRTSIDLESIDISGTNIVDLTPLRALTNLRVLNLSGTPIKDIKKIAELPLLRELDLTNTRLESLDALNAMENLEVVYLSSVPPNSIDILSELRSRGVAIEQQQDVNGVTTAVTEEEVVTIKILTGSDYAPYVGDDLPDGGYSTDLISRALSADPSNDAFTFETIPDWSSHFKPLLTGGTFDLGYPWYRPDCSKRDLLDDEARWRCDNLRFSKPLHEVVIGAYAANDLVEQMNTPEDAFGKRICRPAGYFTHDLEAMGLSVDKYSRRAPSSATECFEDLRDGKTDFVVLNAELSDSIMEKLGMSNNFSEVISMSSVQTLHVVGMRKNQRTRVYLRQIDLGLDTLKQSGDLTRIMQKHL